MTKLIIIARAGLLRGLGGQHEDAGADDRADAEQGQLERAERAVQRLSSRRWQGLRRATLRGRNRPSRGAAVAMYLPSEHLLRREPSGCRPARAIA